MRSLREEWALKLAQAVDDPGLEDDVFHWLRGFPDADVPELAAGLLGVCQSKESPAGYMRAGVRDGWATEAAETNRVRGRPARSFADAWDALCREYADPQTLGPTERSRRQRAVHRFWNTKLPRVAQGAVGENALSTEALNPMTPVQWHEGQWWTLDPDPKPLGLVETYTHPYYPGLELDAYRWDMEIHPDAWPRPEPVSVEVL